MMPLCLCSPESCKGSFPQAVVRELGNCKSFLDLRIKQGVPQIRGRKSQFCILECSGEKMHSQELSKEIFSYKLLPSGQWASLVYATVSFRLPHRDDDCTSLSLRPPPSMKCESCSSSSFSSFLIHNSKSNHQGSHSPTLFLWIALMGNMNEIIQTFSHWECPNYLDSADIMHSQSST